MGYPDVWVRWGLGVLGQEGCSSQIHLVVGADVGDLDGLLLTPDP